LPRPGFGVNSLSGGYNMLAIAFVTLPLLTLSTSLPAPAAPAQRPAAAARAAKQPLDKPDVQSPPIDDLYSLRARRRLATYLRLRMLELRSEGLSRAAEVIEHRLPLDAIAPLP
jgi:hypothetical protein